MGILEDTQARLMTKMFVNGQAFRAQHADDASIPKTLLPKVVCGFNKRFEAAFPGCFIVSQDPAHWNRPGMPGTTQRGVFTLYRNHGPVFSNQNLDACRGRLLRLICQDHYDRDYEAFMRDMQTRFPRGAKPVDSSGDFTFAHWWATCRDESRKEKYGRKVLAGDNDYTSFVEQVRVKEFVRDQAKVLSNTLESFMIGTLWARGRRVIYISNHECKEQESALLMPGQDIVAPIYDQHDQVIVVEYGAAAYGDMKYGPSFVLLHLAPDRRRIIAGAYLADTCFWLWAVFERNTATESYERVRSIFADKKVDDLPHSDHDRRRQIECAESGIRQALLEAHTFLMRRIESLQDRNPPEERAEVDEKAPAFGQTTDHLEQVIRWVKDPLAQKPAVAEPEPSEQDENRRVREVRPHERQRHYRRQRYGKGRQQVKIIEVTATIVHRELFVGRAGNIDIRNVKRQGRESNPEAETGSGHGEQTGSH